MRQHQQLLKNGPRRGKETNDQTFGNHVSQDLDELLDGDEMGDEEPQHFTETNDITELMKDSDEEDSSSVVIPHTEVNEDGRIQSEMKHVMEQKQADKERKKKERKEQRRKEKAELKALIQAQQEEEDADEAAAAEREAREAEEEAAREAEEAEALALAEAEEAAKA